MPYSRFSRRGLIGLIHQTPTPIRPIIRLRWLWCAILLTLLALPSLIHAQGDDKNAVKVGVVVQARGNVSTYCVALSPEKATGLDALRATKLDLNIMAGALGSAVCRLDRLGCGYPADSCFCQCQGARCSYWAYYNQASDGKWQYSQAGAAGVPLKTGAVEGWLWTEATDTTPVGSLPALRFDEICGSGLRTATNGPEAVPTNALTYVGYGLLAILFIGIGGIALWRRRQSVA